MQPTELRPFFVYGTLLPDQPNFCVWGEDIAHMEPATFYGGRLYDMGFYPMLIAAEADTAVHGQLITPHPAQYEAVCQRLDELEGYDPDQPESSDYQRSRLKWWWATAVPKAPGFIWASQSLWPTNPKCPTAVGRLTWPKTRPNCKPGGMPSAA
jgi:gamma-glutamylcyclotransferase (GGCT)/AIG2-like uncharacterized protein YtfP